MTVIVSARFDDSPGAQQFVTSSGGLDISLPSEDALVTSYAESAIGGIVLENARAQLRRTIETKKKMRTVETLDKLIAANDNEDESHAVNENEDSIASNNTYDRTAIATDNNADLQAQYDVINQELRVQQENADRAERTAEAFRLKAKQDNRAAKEAEAAEKGKTENIISDNRELNQTKSRDIMRNHGKKVKNRKNRSHNQEVNLTDVVDEYRRQRAEFKMAPACETKIEK